MTHATWNAIAVLSGFHCSQPNVQACDWTVRGKQAEAFTDDDATELLGGEPSVTLPTCPACCVFIDMALIAREGRTLEWK